MIITNIFSLSGCPIAAEKKLRVQQRSRYSTLAEETINKVFSPSHRHDAYDHKTAEREVGNKSDKLSAIGTHYQCYSSQETTCAIACCVFLDINGKERTILKHNQTPITTMDANLCNIANISKSTPSLLTPSVIGNVGFSRTAEVKQMIVWTYRSFPLHNPIYLQFQKMAAMASNMMPLGFNPFSHNLNVFQTKMMWEQETTRLAALHMMAMQNNPAFSQVPAKSILTPYCIFALSPYSLEIHNPSSVWRDFSVTRICALFLGLSVFLQPASSKLTDSFKPVEKACGE